MRSSLQRYAAAPSRRSFAAVAKPALPSSLVKSWYNAYVCLSSCDELLLLLVLFSSLCVALPKRSVARSIVGN